MIVVIFLVSCFLSNQEDVELDKVTLPSEESSIDKILTNEDRICLVNKWHFDLFDSQQFRLLSILLNACIEYPIIQQIINDEKFGNNFSVETVKNLKKWALNKIVHIQTLREFENEPGRMPWGANDNIPTYKKTLPSEMLAMVKFTSKYSAECTSITNFIYSLLIKLGLEDGIILRLDKHTIGVFKIEDSLYLIDNNFIGSLREEDIRDLCKLNFYGFYNNNVSYKGNIKLNRSALLLERSLLEGIMELNSLNDDMLFKYDSNFEDVFYALQCLDVDNNNLILEASIRGPIVRKLSTEFQNINEILEWIKNNIQSNHILEYPNSIQTADQTIVFKTGNIRDKGMLAFTIAKSCGFEGELVITSIDTYLIIDSSIYSMEELSKVIEIKGETLYKFE